MNHWPSNVLFASSPAMFKDTRKQPRIIAEIQTWGWTNTQSKPWSQPPQYPSPEEKGQKKHSACEMYCRRLKPPSGAQPFLLHTNTPVAYLTNSAIWFLDIQFCPGFKRDKEWTQINDSRSDSWKGRQKQQQQNSLGPLSLGAHSSSYFKEP